MTSIDLAAAYSERPTRQRKESPLGLYIAVIKEKPSVGEAMHKKAFKRLVLQDGYEEFVESIIDEWQSIKYSTALRAAQPPSVQEIKQHAEKRRQERAQEDAATDTAKKLIGSRLLDLVTPNGKPLRDCTGAECIKFGGFYTAIGNKIGPRKIVGSVLSADDVVAILKSKG